MKKRFQVSIAIATIFTIVGALAFLRFRGTSCTESTWEAREAWVRAVDSWERVNSIILEGRLPASLAPDISVVADAQSILKEIRRARDSAYAQPREALDAARAAGLKAGTECDEVLRNLPREELDRIIARKAAEQPSEGMRIVEELSLQRDAASHEVACQIRDALALSETSWEKCQYRAY